MEIRLQAPYVSVTIRAGIVIAYSAAAIRSGVLSEHHRSRLQGTLFGESNARKEPSTMRQAACLLVGDAIGAHGDCSAPSRIAGAS